MSEKICSWCGKKIEYPKYTIISPFSTWYFCSLTCYINFIQMQVKIYKMLEKEKGDVGED